MTYAVKIPKFTVIELFIFPVQDFQFFKILWKGVKHGKHNFQRESLTVAIKVELLKKSA